MKRFVKPMLAALCCAVLVLGSVLLLNMDKQTTVSAYAAEDGVTDFVSRLYTEIMGREADENGLATWTNALTSGEFSGTEVAKGFIMSDEFLGKEMTNEEFVQIMYRAFFGREADANGLQTWVDFLDQGYRKSYVFAGFANSDEFVALCDSYEVAAGSVPVTISEQQPNLSDEDYNIWLFVERLYTEVLDRTPDMAGIKEWVDYLKAGTFSGAEVAEGFIMSTEFQNQYVSDEEYVQIMYKTFFGREADPAGLETWVNALETNSKKYVFAGFANSTEFGNLCESFDIERGTVAALEGAPEFQEVCNIHGVYLYINELSGANQYAIWRSETGAEGSYVCLDVVTNEGIWPYTDEAVEHNTLYYYTVSALDPGTGTYGPMSEAEVILFLDTPYSMSAFTTSSDSITCNWRGYPDVDGYIVFVENYNGYEEEFVIEGAASTTYTITGLQAETYYDVAVRCYKETELGTFESTWIWDGVTTIADEENQYGTFSYEELEDGTLVLTYYEGNESNVVIPSEIDGKKVTMIGAYCFETYCETMITVQIPDTITYIDEYAFSSCYNLQEVTIPNSVIYIGDGAFDYCESLTKLHIPASVQSFYLYTYEYDDGEIEREQYTMYGMSQLKEVTVDAANPSYTAVDGILYNKDKTQLIYVPNAYEGVVTIENTVTNMKVYDAFSECYYVTEIVIPKNMEHFDNSIYGCYNLEKYTVASGNQYYTTIDGVLYDIEKTTLVSVPILCTGTSYSIRSGVVSVDDLAFVSCDSIKQIHVPASVEWLGSLRGGTRAMGGKDNVYENAYENIFENCYNLVAITVDAANEYYKAVDGILFSKDGEALITYPREKEGEVYAVPEGVTTIGMNAFYGIYQLKKVSLPASVEVVQPWAFGSSGLEEVEFSEGLKRIGYRAFAYIDAAELLLPDSVERIDMYAFQACYDLENIKLSENLNYIGRAAFQNCRALTAITIPEGVTSILEHTFYNCRELTDVGLPSTLTSIASRAFYRCAIPSITLPGNLESIHESAFVGSELSTIFVPAGSVTEETIAEIVELYDYEVFTY